jgi:deoxyadenosine/deoxycytidine kinase
MATTTAVRPEVSSLVHGTLGDKMMSEPPLFGMLSGMIGAGKTVLADAIGARFGIKVYHEMDKNKEQLERFYADPAQYAFPLQIHLLTQRANLQDSIPIDEPAILDRSPYEDYVFAWMLCHDKHYITPEDYVTYNSLSRFVHSKLRRPTVIIHLDVSPELAIARIRGRGRPMEAGIDIEYMRALSRAYEKFLGEISRIIPVIRVDWKLFPDEISTDSGAVVDKLVDSIVMAISEMKMLKHVSPSDTCQSARVAE